MKNEIKKIDTLEILKNHLAKNHNLTAKHIYDAGVINHNQKIQENSKQIIPPAKRLMAARLAVRGRSS